MNFLLNYSSIYYSIPHRIMHFKARKLPILHCSKNKSLFIKDRSKIEDLLLQNARTRGTQQDYRYQEEFSQLRAANFVSRVETIDNPRVIFTVADQIKQLSSALSKQNQPSKVQSELKKQQPSQSQFKRMNQERQQALNLGRWMDEKIKKFKAKTSITFMDILQYKQNILNYALGRIIDSLTKKCKEQGQLLSLIWNNTFVMFEGVFNILVDVNKEKQKEKIAQAKQLHGIYQTNHSFLKEENLVLSQQNKAIFQKMRNVIVWNKKLRKERKQLFTQNRVLEYRLQTYTQSLEQTVQMLLQSAAQPATIQTAKNIIQKLGKERNRKRNFNKRKSDEQFSANVKQMVYSWLKNNSFLNNDIVKFMNQFSAKKEDCFIFEQLKDHNEMKKVDIYDFFKLYDYGVQVSAEMKNDYTQSEVKVYRGAEVMTNGTNTIEHGCQTVEKFDFKLRVDEIQEKRSILSKTRQNARLKENIVGQKSMKKIKKEIVSNKSFKNLKGNKSADLQQQKFQDKQMEKKKFRPRRSNIENSFHVKPQKLTQEDQYAQSKLLEAKSVALDDGKISNSRLEKGASIMKRCKSQFQNSSVTDSSEEEKGFKDIATKNLITNNSLKGRQKSMRDFADQYTGSSRNIALSKKRREKKSLTYGAGTSLLKSAVRLNLKKKFNEAYRQNKEFMKNNTEQFFDQIVRRRSFFMKKRVEFSSLLAAEETAQKVRDYWRGNKSAHNYLKSFYQNANYVSSNIEQLAKKFSAPTNISKTKILLSAQNVFTSITTAIQKMARLPPKNKVFVNNSLSMITKYIQELIPDYLKQIRREKQELASNDCEKTVYPLNILLMERMAFKYGLKEIAEKKIKKFIEKVLTFAPVSQKVELYGILLGLQDPEVGSDELLVYLKCLVYFDFKKGLRQTSNTDSSKVDLDIVHENIRKILEYFFDHEYINLVQLKLEMYFQHNALNATIQGIAIIIIKELLKRKKDLKERYLKIHQICAYGDNFYTNAFNMLKIYANYHIYAEKQAQAQFKYSKNGKRDNQNSESVEALQKIRKRQKGKKTEVKEDPTVYNITKISSIIRELFQRSDIIDEQYGKSITPERFVTAAVICGVPSFDEFEKVLTYLKNRFLESKIENPLYQNIQWSNWRAIQKLEKLWLKSSVGRSEDPAVNSWTLSKLYSDKIEQEVVSAMGMLGTVGLYLQSSLFNLGIES